MVGILMNRMKQKSDYFIEDLKLLLYSIDNEMINLNSTFVPAPYKLDSFLKVI